jgi:membrane protein DedA with SNARE-associated domain
MVINCWRRRYGVVWHVTNRRLRAMGTTFCLVQQRCYQRAFNVTWFPHEQLQQFISTHGYWAVALVVGLESMGLPLPGETVLVLATIYAATDPNISVWLVITAAALGSIIGDNVGYWLGKKFGYALLLQYGSHIGMSDARIKIGQYLFLRHGGKVVFFGRFVALLRILAAVLAGVNRMPWRSFLPANAGGAVIWAAVFGVGGYLFGKVLLQLHGAVGPIAFVVATTVLLGGGLLMRRFEVRLADAAERALPGPLESVIKAKRT